MKTKKLMSLFIATIMLLVLVPHQTVSAAVKISKKKATLEVDATLKLSISGTTSKVTWKSSKESVATVNSKGIVSAKKSGTTTITATVDKKNHTCSVYVVNSKNASIAVGETVEYSSGEYLIGEDIPAGTYTLRAIVGSGSTTIYKTEKDYENDTYNYDYAFLAAKGTSALESFSSMYSETYKNLRLKEKNYLTVDSGLTLEIKRTK